MTCEAREAPKNKCVVRTVQKILLYMLVGKANQHIHEQTLLNAAKLNMSLFLVQYDNVTLDVRPFRRQIVEVQTSPHAKKLTSLKYLLLHPSRRVDIGR